jgi:hypothetical protein
MKARQGGWRVNKKQTRRHSEPALGWPASRDQNSSQLLEIISVQLVQLLEIIALILNTEDQMNFYSTAAS